MNKSNKILLGVLSFIVVCVIGYALFSDQVTVTGTIKGKGDFDVVPTCTLGYSDDLINAGVATSTDMNQKGFGEDSCNIVDGEVKFTTNLDYPGAKRYFTVKIKNIGTIPATFDESKLSSEGLYEILEQYINIKHVDDFITGGTPGQLEYYNNKGEKTAADVFKLLDVGIIESDNYCSYKDLCFDNFESIKTGESLYFVLAFEWPEDYARNYFAEYYDVNSVYYTFVGTMKIPLRQTTLE